jgi:hypothetical protein
MFWDQSPSWKAEVAQLVKKLLAFMEPKYLFPHSQDLPLGYNGPDECNPHPHTLFNIDNKKLTTLEHYWEKANETNTHIHVNVFVSFPSSQQHSSTSTYIYYKIHFNENFNLKEKMSSLS